MAESQVKSREAKPNFDEHVSEAMAKVYSNCSTAYYRLGDFHQALNDATTAVKLKPTLIKAIETGAMACIQLQCYDEAISWCEKGLAIDSTSKTLLDLQARCVADPIKLEEPKSNPGTHSVKGKKNTDYLLKTTEDVGDNTREGTWYSNVYNTLGDFPKTIEYHERRLKVAKEVGDRAGEGGSYDNLGNTHHGLGDLKIAKDVGHRAGEGDLKKAIEYHEHHLKIAKEVGDRAGEGRLYGNLGNAYDSLGDFKKAIECHERCLKIAREVGDKAGEGRSYGSLGNAYHSLGDFKKAIEYHEIDLKIAIEVGDRASEGMSYGNLGNAYDSFGDFKKAIKYHERHLKVVTEVGDRAGEGMSYGNLGNAYYGLGDFKKAIKYHEHHLKIAKEFGDRAGEGRSYGNLGNAYDSLGDFKTAIECHERHLNIAKQLEDRADEGKSYGNLGNAYYSLGDFKKAIEYHKRRLKIAREVGDRAGEGRSYGSLGNAYHSLGDFKCAIEYHELDLKIATEVRDRAGEGMSYGNLGNAYQSLGDFKKAIKYHGRHLEIAKAVGDRAGEGMSNGNLGNAHYSLGDFKKAIEYHEHHLKIAKEIGDRAGEGCSYGNLGNDYHSLGDFKKAIEYHGRHLKIAKEVGDRAGEGKSYGNLGKAHYSLRDFKKAIEYHERHLKIAREVGDRSGEGSSSLSLGICFESQGFLKRALAWYHSSVQLFNDIRQHLHGEDEWKISYRNVHDLAYARLWRLMLKQGDVVEALFAVEQGRAQALKDLMNLNYDTETPDITDKMTFDTLSCLPMNTVVMAVHEREIIFWIIQKGKNVQLRRKEISHNNSEDFATALLHSLIQNVFADINFSSHRGFTYQDCPLDWIDPLRTLYDIIISPIKDLINGNELVFVPEGPLCLAPYAALMDSNSKYLGESFRIRLIPSLHSLKFIKDCPPDYHKKSGALLVGDPWLGEVRDCGLKLQQLPCARKEVTMIGEILKVDPLTGKEATKDEVLRRISSVALVHIAANGFNETGETVLAANPTRASQIPVEEDFLLKMSDVMRVKMHAKLVVLSYCHSGRGEIKAEGVVGIARAFLGAGARSVLVSLWLIEDEAALEFMKSFYLHLKEGESASESLNRAMKCLRESEKFSEVKYWAPFVLIGDDVTLDFAKGD